MQFYLNIINNNCTLSYSDNELITKNKYSVYTQNDTIYIVNKLNKSFTVTLLDISGKIIAKKNSINSFIKLDSSTLNKGVYIINILEAKGRIESKKIIIN
jgi:hypothetical protein